MFDRRAKWCIWRLNTRTHVQTTRFCRLVPEFCRLVTVPKRPAISSGGQVASQRQPNMLSQRPWVDMWRRTTGGLLEVHRCALGSDASLPVIWRSICGRARIQGLGEQQLLGTRSPPRLPPLGVRALSMALSMARTGTDDLHVRPWLSRAAR